MRKIYEYLRAWTARTCVGHLPEVVVRAEPVDARIGKTCDLAPERACFIVGFEDAHAQMLPVELQLFGEELPREAYRIVLEVVAE